MNRAQLEHMQKYGKAETHMLAGYALGLQERINRLRELVDEQRHDWRLWFEAKTEPELRLQREISRLHGAVET